MAYTATYNGDDFGAIIIDVLGAIAVVFVSLASVIGLILVLGWASKRVRLG